MKTHLVSHIPHCDEHGECERSERHDAYFCRACDEWAEPRCSDDWCNHCDGRPARPAEHKPREETNVGYEGLIHKRYNGPSIFIATACGVHDNPKVYFRRVDEGPVTCLKCLAEEESNEKGEAG